VKQTHDISLFSMSNDEDAGQVMENCSPTCLTRVGDGTDLHVLVKQLHQAWSSIIARAAVV
jgi:hypothetical protein